MQDNHFQTPKVSIHFVDGDTQMRAEMMRIGMALGLHCEIYSDFNELATYPPRSGIIIVRDRPEFGGMAVVLDRLLAMGVNLPVVAMDMEPAPGRIVKAVKEGALDYLVLPLRPERLSSCLSRIHREAAQVAEIRQLRIEADRKLSTLSRREREVLDALASGMSNKDIARKLDISPRTVEIHRANMMVKLGARHSAEAIRIHLEAKMDSNSSTRQEAA